MSLKAYGCDIDSDGVSVSVLNPHDVTVSMSDVRAAARTVVEYVRTHWCKQPTVTMYPDYEPLGNWTWWAYPSALEDEPEGNHTNWLHADGSIECYGVAEECDSEDGAIAP